MRSSAASLALMLLAAACQQPESTPDKGDQAADRDGDGYLDSVDCDDRDPEVTTATTWYADEDGDGYGDPQTSTTACQRPAGYVADATDCDDASADIRPGVSERCDGIDNDCDGAIDEEAADLSTWYADADGDGYGNPDQDLRACEMPANAVDNAGDCDDGEPAAWYGADERCDGIDNNCNGGTDENAVDALTWYQDADGDGQGGTTTAQSCEQPRGYVDNGDDCDDDEAGAYAGAREVCDGIDNDCDGTTDEDALDTPAWYLDADGDGFGDPATATLACEWPSSDHVGNADDCDDGEPAAYSGADEICDGVDNDCDGGVDIDAVDALTWYEDADGDGYGDAGLTTLACSCPEELADNGEDCDDGDAAINPAATEICSDDVDDDCDGILACIGSLSEADLELIGEERGNAAAYAVSSGGDVNADGFVDLLIGAPDNGARGEDDGAAYLVHGAASFTSSAAFDLAASAAVMRGSYDSGAGGALAGVGDTDGDGYDDVLVGASGVNTGGVNTGAAYLLRGPLSGEIDLRNADVALYGENTSDRAGCAVSGAGDVDGDGLADLLVGARSVGATDGAAYLVLGTVSGDQVLVDASLAKYTGSNGEACGYSLAGVGDADGDGLDDLLVGAPYNSVAASYAGAAYLVRGGTVAGSMLFAAQAELLGERLSDRAGDAVAGAGDVDGDGRPDLLVGACLEDAGGSSAGAAYLVLSPVTGSISLAAAEAKLMGHTTTDYAGDEVAGAGDVDGDGYDDLLVGAPYEDTAGDGAGAAYLVFGPVSGMLDLSETDLMFTGEVSGDNAGGAVAGAGDVNGDGYDDLLVGAPGADSGIDAGAAYLILDTSFAQ